MDISRLRALRELRRCRTMAAAAEALYLTPSAISQQVAQLEEEAGIALTERQGRGVRLTPAGLGRSEVRFRRLDAGFRWSRDWRAARPGTGHIWRTMQPGRLQCVTPGSPARAGRRQFAQFAIRPRRSCARAGLRRDHVHGDDRQRHGRSQGRPVCESGTRRGRARRGAGPTLRDGQESGPNHGASSVPAMKASHPMKPVPF